MQQYPTFNGIPTGNFSYALAPPPAPYPQVVGEGDVASLTLPDGSVQLYFVPAANYQCPVAWFIRTIPNLFPAQQPAQNQQFDKVPSNHTLRQFWAPEKPGHQLQFHNDKTTSSTDMHYFCKTRPSYWDSKPHEVEQPVRLHAMSCCKVCSCKNCRQGSAMSIDRSFDESRDIKRNMQGLRLNLDKRAENVVKSVKQERQTSEKSVQSVQEQQSQASAPCACRGAGPADDAGCSCP